MAFQISPGVLIQERDLTAIIPAVATTPAGIAGYFTWGPVDQRVIIDGESNLRSLFGTPDNAAANYFFSASNFLQYGNNLTVVRSVISSSLNAIGTTAGTIGVLIKNSESWDANVGNSGYTTAAVKWAAKWPGAFGNSLVVEACDGGTAFNAWGLSSEFPRSPGTSPYLEDKGFTQANDEIHVVVIDRDGVFSGYKNAVLEKFYGLSKCTDAKGPDGSNNFYADVINSDSKYIWWMNNPNGVSTNSSLTISSNPNQFGLIAAQTVGAGLSLISSTFVSGATTISSAGLIGFALTGGSAAAASTSTLSTTTDPNVGYGMFADADSVNVSLLLGGPLTGNDAANVANLARTRKDCVAFFSAPNNNPLASVSTKQQNCIAFQTAIGNNSYAFIDSGYKYQYDRYNDVYRYVPLNGDIAGLCARTDLTNDPWFSPAGLNRGQVKNVIKLAFNPTETDRDVIYPKGVNPVVTFPGDGTVLFGDRTAQTKPSAFDRINVRRLFIVLEKSVAIAAKYQLFEFNDQFTRSQFVGFITPFLRDVQSRRGVYDFKVICDETNNTPEVIDANRFVADIYIKPARSINFIQLNFVATRTGVDFNEIATISQPGLNKSVS